MSRQKIRRVAYGAAALATVFGAGGGMAGFVGMMAHAGGIGPGFWPFAALPIAMAAGVLLLIAGAFLSLARKPQGWGKLLCLVGFPWIGFTAIVIVFREQTANFYNPLMLLPGLGGLTLLVAGIVLLVQDRGRLVSQPAD